MEEANEHQHEEDEHGVLLYYNYAQIPHLDQLFAFYESNCKSLHLLGRVRLSSLGVNVTVGGRLSSLKKHIAELEAYDALFRGTDFKLAACPRPLNDVVARECGFASLSIRIVKELVTLHSDPLLEPPDITSAGKHLSALEFHSVLQKTGKSSEGESLVLLDARNLYETRIGKFDVPNVETLDPTIRQYSDLPSWVDNNSEKLRGKNVLMYCTGGIRCEMASAYIRSKGAGFENVFQLYGGIQRYLEQFPDGGFYKGKNFVFDHRISVGSSGTDTMGCCLVCDVPFDDYSRRLRCSYCRMLVLVCDSCQEGGPAVVCELCKKHGQSDVLNELTTCFSDTKLSPCIPQMQDVPHQRKLRILCLHGFRQNASGFKGRTASLAKKLKKIVEFIYVDAPHELPFIYQPNTTVSNENLPQKCNKKFAWLVDPANCSHGGNEWKMADSSFNALQYQEQIGGFDTSLAFLEEVFSREKKLDGVMGFSQGAAMAAALCAQLSKLGGKIEFKFAILCSGFAPKLPELRRGLIEIPSLHIFGSDDGKDRQIANRASSELALLFDEGCSVRIQHDSGHIIPTRSPYIDEVKQFLQRFL